MTVVNDDDGCGGFMIGNVSRVLFCDIDGGCQRNDCEKLIGMVKGWSGTEYKWVVMKKDISLI